MLDYEKNFAFFVFVVFAGQSITINSIEQQERDGTSFSRNYMRVSERLVADITVFNSLGWRYLRYVKMAFFPDDRGTICSPRNIIDSKTREYRCVLTVPFVLNGWESVKIITVPRYGDGISKFVGRYYLNPSSNLETNRDIEFLGKFAPEKTLYTKWIRLTLDSPIKITDKDIYLYGNNVYCQRTYNLVPYTKTYCKRRRVCNRTPKIVTKCYKKRVCEKVYYNFTNGHTKRVYYTSPFGTVYMKYRYVCHYQTTCYNRTYYRTHCNYVTECYNKTYIKRVYTKCTPCPSGNYLDLSNYEYTTDGTTWNPIPYRKDMVNLGKEPVWIRFRVNIPEVCGNNYPLEDAIRFRVK